MLNMDESGGVFVGRRSVLVPHTLSTKPSSRDRENV